MSDYDDTNRGALFRNNKKENDKQPDYTGVINVDGVEKRLAAWLRESSKGTKYMSIAVSDPLPPQDEPASARNEQMQPLADAIPF